MGCCWISFDTIRSKLSTTMDTCCKPNHIATSETVLKVCMTFLLFPHIVKHLKVAPNDFREWSERDLALFRIVTITLTHLVTQQTHLQVKFDRSLATRGKFSKLCLFKRHFRCFRRGSLRKRSFTRCVYSRHTIGIAHGETSSRGQ